MLIALCLLRHYSISDMDQLLYKAVNNSNREKENKTCANCMKMVLTVSLIR